VGKFDENSVSLKDGEGHKMTFTSFKRYCFLLSFLPAPQSALFSRCYLYVSASNALIYRVENAEDKPERRQAVDTYLGAELAALDPVLAYVIYVGELSVLIYVCVSKFIGVIFTSTAVAQGSHRTRSSIY
jgi:hypothetical protein